MRTFAVWLPDSVYFVTAEDTAEARMLVAARASVMVEPYATEHLLACEIARVDGPGPLGLHRVIRTWPQGDHGCY